MNDRAWKDEIVLALDLYRSSGNRVLETWRPEVIALAAFLNRLRVADPEFPNGPIRTPGSVKAKMANLRALDPNTPSNGWGITLQLIGIFL